MEKTFRARNGESLQGRRKSSGGKRRRGVGGGCEVKSAEPARLKGPRNSAELPLIAQYDGIVGLLALKPYQSIVTFCFN